MKLDRGGPHIKGPHGLAGNLHQIWQLEFDIKHRSARSAQQVVVPFQSRIVARGRPRLLNLNQMPILDQRLERPVNRAERNVRHELTHRLEDAGGIGVLSRGLNGLEDGLALTGESDDGHKGILELSPEESHHSRRWRWNQ